MSDQEIRQFVRREIQQALQEARKGFYRYLPISLPLADHDPKYDIWNALDLGLREVGKRIEHDMAMDDQSGIK